MKTEHTKHQRAKITLADKRYFALSLKNKARSGDPFAQAALLLLDKLEVQQVAK